MVPNGGCVENGGQQKRRKKAYTKLDELSAEVLRRFVGFCCSQCSYWPPFHEVFAKLFLCTTLLLDHPLTARVSGPWPGTQMPPAGQTEHHRVAPPSSPPEVRHARLRSRVGRAGLAQAKPGISHVVQHACRSEAERICIPDTNASIICILVRAHPTIITTVCRELGWKFHYKDCTPIWKHVGRRQDHFPAQLGSRYGPSGTSFGATILSKWAIYNYHNYQSQGIAKHDNRLHHFASTFIASLGTWIVTIGFLIPLFQWYDQHKSIQNNRTDCPSTTG